MNKKPYVTEFKAIDPYDNSLKKWSGETIWAESWEAAQNWCKNNKGHLLVIGELYTEIPCDKNFNPNWNEAIHYDMFHLNGKHITDS